MSLKYTRSFIQTQMLRAKEVSVQTTTELWAKIKALDFNQPRKFFCPLLKLVAKIPFDVK